MRRNDETSQFVINSNVYIFFLLIEYVLRTFVELYKYHLGGLLFVFLPLVIASVITSIFYKKVIETEKFGFICSKLVLISVAGFLTAKSILFFQWYWIIAPEYGNFPGDMDEGLAWNIFDFIVGSIVIVLSYLITILTIKTKQRTITT